MGGRKKNYTIKNVTFLISLVSMHLSILKTVDMSMCSLEMEFSHVVKLSTVARNSTQVNFKMLNILLMMLSRRKGDNVILNEHDFRNSVAFMWSSDVLPKPGCVLCSELPVRGGAPDPLQDMGDSCHAGAHHSCSGRIHTRQRQN